MLNVLKLTLRPSTRAFSRHPVICQLSENKLQIGKYAVNYVKTGSQTNDAKRPAVILLPGALGSARSDFQPQIEALPALLPNHTIIAWDPPGYGKSRPPAKKFHLDFYEEDAGIAHELMQKLDLPSYSVLGWSDGGITGLFMASLFPKSVQKLAIWGSNAYVLEEEIAIYEKIRDVSKWSEKMRQPMEEVYGKEGFARLWSDWIDALRDIFERRGGNICKEHLANIKCPTFILHGAKDPMIAAEHVPFLQKHIRRSRLHVFPDGKHNVHLRYAAEFNQLVANFLLAEQDSK